MEWKTYPPLVSGIGAAALARALGFGLVEVAAAAVIFGAAGELLVLAYERVFEKKGQ